MDLVRIEQYEASGQTIELSVNRSTMKEAIQRRALLLRRSLHNNGHLLLNIYLLSSMYDRSAFGFRKVTSMSISWS